MNSFFGIGLAELVFILLIAGLLLGPREIGKFARTAGVALGKGKALLSSWRAQLASELSGAEAAEMRATLQDMEELQQQLLDLRREMQNMLTQKRSYQELLEMHDLVDVSDIER
jgi:Sec-independent protein translocase protein TatA